jgi:hypothetical protein
LNNDWLLVERLLYVLLLLANLLLYELLLVLLLLLYELLWCERHLRLLVDLRLEAGLLSNNYLRSTIALAIHSDSHVGALICAHHNNCMSLKFLSSEVDSTSWHALKENLDILFVVLMEWSN